MAIEAPAERSLRHQLAALIRVAQSDPTEMTAPMRAAYKRSFLAGHGGDCSVCPTRIEIPADLPPAERERRAAVLRKIHFMRLGQARWAGARAATG